MSARDRRSSNYAGAQVTMSALTRRHNAKAGFYGFYQRDDDLFALRGSTDKGTPISLTQTLKLNGNLAGIVNLSENGVVLH